MPRPRDPLTRWARSPRSRSSSACSSRRASWSPPCSRPLGAGTVPAWLSIPVTVLLALGVTQLLAVGMTSPLRQMTEAARRMAAGDYDVRVQTQLVNDEVGELARAFNTMSADLATVDRQRRDLVASVSHELRTPLAALVAVLENLDDGVIAPDPETVHVARAQAERLGDLVDDLLDLSRLDAGVVPLDRAEPAGRYRSSRRSSPRPAPGPAPSQRGVSFEVRVDPPDLDGVRRPRPPAPAAGQPARQRGPAQPGRGRRARLGRSRRRHDPPRGRRPGTRHRAAGPRAGLRTVRHAAGLVGGGTGLGLAIARWVTDLHGGRITVVDPVPGPVIESGGARFRVELPHRTTERTPTHGRHQTHPTPLHRRHRRCRRRPPRARELRLPGRRRLRQPLGRPRRPAASLGAAGVPGHRRVRRADPAVRQPRPRAPPSCWSPPECSCSR